MSYLVERLRALAVEYHQHRPHYEEAADRIEALEADVVKWEEFANDMLDGKNKRIEALEKECFALAANQSHAGYGDDYGNHRCKRIEALKAVLRQALDCICDETPEDMSREDARDDTIEKIRAALAPEQDK